MEEQFILRVSPTVAERIERLLNDPTSSSEDKSLDLSFSEDGRTGSFVIGSDHFSASLLDLPTVVESYKTYDDSALIKTADIGQMIMVTEEGDSVPDTVEYRHGLTPPMRDARRRRFRREPDLNPEVVRRVEKDLQNIMAGGTAENINILQHVILGYLKATMPIWSLERKEKNEFQNICLEFSGKSIPSLLIDKFDVLDQILFSSFMR